MFSRFSLLSIVMKRFYRFFAKLLDYIWFSSLGLFLLDALNFGEFSYFVALFLLPLLFSPVEALLLFLFKTTLGKALFGLFYDRRLSLMQSFSLSFKKGLIILPLFLPVINLFFLFMYLKEWKQHPTKRFDIMSPARLVETKQRVLRRIFLFALAFLVSFASFMPTTFISHAKQIGPYADKGIGIFRPGDWIEFTSKEKSFTALFPDKPKFIEKDFPVPRTDEVLTYKEHTDKGPTNKHSVGSLELPTDWTTKWGPQTVLKGALYILSDGRKIIKKEKAEHENFPATLYEMRQKDHYILGKLVLVENTLFKLEVESDHPPTEEERMLANSFFTAFHPLSPSPDVSNK
jgi:hypothetical protein